MALPPSDPLLPGDQLVWQTKEDFTRPVLPEFSAQGTLHGDGHEREFIPASWYVAAAAFALHHEGLAA
jgi:hypothetical protein